jgi:hypothetical protein
MVTEGKNLAVLNISKLSANGRIWGEYKENVSKADLCSYGAVMPKSYGIAPVYNVLG